MRHAKNLLGGILTGIGFTLYPVGWCARMLCYGLELGWKSADIYTDECVCEYVEGR